MAPEFEFVYTENPKIQSLGGIIEEINKYELNYWNSVGQRWSSGLVTMCGDILHRGHLDFLNEAKRHVDTLIVGVDRDETVALKGEGRPNFRLRDRCELIAGLESVDLVFPLPFVLNRYEESEENAKLFEELTRKLFWSTKLFDIEPYYLITNESADSFWQEKKRRAEKLQINYLGLNLERPTSSTEVARRVVGGT